MEVHFTAELEKKLNDLAAQSGRPTGELVQDAVAGMFDGLAGHGKCSTGARTKSKAAR